MALECDALDAIAQQTHAETEQLKAERLRREAVQQAVMAAAQAGTMQASAQFEADRAEQVPQNALADRAITVATQQRLAAELRATEAAIARLHDEQALAEGIAARAQAEREAATLAEQTLEAKLRPKEAIAAKRAAEETALSLAQESSRVAHTLAEKIAAREAAETAALQTAEQSARLEHEAQLAAHLGIETEEFMRVAAEERIAAEHEAAIALAQRTETEIARIDELRMAALGENDARNEAQKQAPHSAEPVVAKGAKPTSSAPARAVWLIVASAAFLIGLWLGAQFIGGAGFDVGDAPPVPVATAPATTQAATPIAAALPISAESASGLAAPGAADVVDAPVALRLDQSLREPHARPVAAPKFRSKSK